MLKKLRLKFVCINMFIVTMMLLVIFGMLIGFTKSSLEADSLRMMQSIAENSYQLGIPSQPSEDVRLPYFTIQIGVRGEIIAASGGYYDLSDQEFLLRVMEAALRTSAQNGILEEYDLRFYRRISLTGQCLVFADITSEQATVSNLIQTCVFLGILGFLVFFAVSLLLARWAVKPVEQAWAQQKQFVADASHELKTPLTVILTNTELMQDPSCDENSRRQSTDNILAMCHQMRGLVEGLLELARGDNGTAHMQFETVNWSELIEEELLPFEPLLFEADLLLESDVTPSMQVWGSSQHLRQVVDILLDNAQKYSSAGGVVQVSLARQGGSGLLTVSTPGQPMTPEECKNIFKRFYRADQVRHMSGSYGLGLSIAESTVHAHKGRIWAEGRGTRNFFYVQLPLADAGR